MENYTKKADYDSVAHEKFIMRFHIIFSTKYRKKCLVGIEDKIRIAIERAEKMQNKWWIELMEMDKDHIHFLIRSTPTVIPYEIIHKLKQVSTYDIWKTSYEHMRKFYWKQHHLWTRGYFLSTIGDVSVATIKEYIKNQG